MQKQVTLNPGSSQRVQFLIAPTTQGTYSVQLNSLAGTFEAISAVPFDPWVYDANGDCYIDKSETLTATVDYFDMKITKDQIEEIMYLYENNIRNPACPLPLTITIYPLACRLGAGHNWTAEITARELEAENKYIADYPAEYVYPQKEVYHFDFGQEEKEGPRASVDIWIYTIHYPIYTLPAIEATGMKLIVPLLEGRNWTCYVDTSYRTSNGGYSGIMFKTLDVVSGSGSTVKLCKTMTLDEYRAKEKGINYYSDSFMLRIESDIGRIIITNPYSTSLWHTPIIRPLWEIPRGEGDLEYRLDILNAERNALIEIYNKYTRTCFTSYVDRVDLDFLVEMGYGFYGGGECIRPNYTIGEIEAKYANLIEAKNAEWANEKAELQALLNAYQENWLDP